MGIKWIYDDALKLFVFYDKLYTDMAVYKMTEALINRINYENNIQINFKIMKHLNYKNYKFGLYLICSSSYILVIKLSPNVGIFTVSPSYISL